jgi:preprotein translocase subunit SecE
MPLCPTKLEVAASRCGIGAHRFCLEIREGCAYLRRNPFIRRKMTMSKTNPVQFMQQVRAEVAKVSWPTRREVMLTTVMVFIMAALTATFFSIVDIVIRFGLTTIVGGF